MNVGYRITNSGAVMVQMDGQIHNVTTDHVNYGKIIECLKNAEYDKLPLLMDLVSSVKAFVKVSDKVEVNNGQIMYLGTVIDNSLTRRMFEFMQKDLPFMPLVRFLENVMQNSSARAVNELYGFLEANDIPLTDDGMFLGYKRIRADWTDCYTGTIDNSIGKKPAMIRNMVNDDCTQTCSSGLHVCSLAYLRDSGFGREDGAHIVIVKVNPKDVVSVPIDYNNTKMRVCEYEVVEEYKGTELKGLTEPLYSSDGSEYVNDDESDEEVCDDCGEHVDDCSCEFCDYCGELIDECVCSEDDGNDDSETEDEDHDCENCDDTSCGSHPDYNKAAPTPAIGYKPDGSAYHNLRDKSGKFKPRS